MRDEPGGTREEAQMTVTSDVLPNVYCMLSTRWRSLPNHASRLASPLLTHNTTPGA